MDPTVPDPGEIVGHLDPELLPSAAEPNPAIPDSTPAAVDSPMVPVIVAEVGAERWRSTRFDLAAGIPKIVGQYVPGRKSILIVNRHASETVYLAPRRDVTTSEGFPLPAGGEVKISSVGEVWAIAAAASLVYAVETMAP